jgi:hypothetical protein
MEVGLGAKAVDELPPEIWIHGILPFLPLHVRALLGRVSRLGLGLLARVHAEQSAAALLRSELAPWAQEVDASHANSSAMQRCGEISLRLRDEERFLGLLSSSPCLEAQIERVKQANLILLAGRLSRGILFRGPVIKNPAQEGDLTWDERVAEAGRIIDEQMNVQEPGDLNLSDLRLTRVPDVVGQMRIRALNLSCNRLTSLPEELKNWSLLSIVDLRNNQIRHASVRGLRRGCMIDLRQNPLTAPPDGIDERMARMVRFDQ